MKPSALLLSTLIVLVYCASLANTQKASDDVISAQQVQSDNSNSNNQQQQQQQPTDNAAATPAPTKDTSPQTTLATPQPTTDQPPPVTTTANNPEPTTTAPPAVTTENNTPTQPTDTNTNTDNNNNNINQSTASTKGGKNPAPSSNTNTGNRGNTAATATVNSNPTVTATDGSTTAGGSDAQATQGQQSSINNKAEEPNDNKTAIIAGSVVGGLVGIALIAGILTWLNRRGGCTSRTKNRGHLESGSELYDDDNFYKQPSTTIDNIPSTMVSSPFQQHARRFVPPTTAANTGYMNLTDDEQLQQQQYHSMGPAVGGTAPTTPTTATHMYIDQIPYNSSSVVGSNNGDYYNPQGQYQEYPGSQLNATAAPGGSIYYNPHQAITSPITPTAVHQFKPDEIDQKPNAA